MDKYQEQLEDLADSAHMALAWLGMSHHGTTPLIPEEGWSMQELTLRLVNLREEVRMSRELLGGGHDG